MAQNVLAYLPTQTIEEAETTEFTVTIALFVVFVITSIAAWILAIKNHREIGLIALLLLSFAFVMLSYFGGSLKSPVRTTLQFSYAIIVLGVAAVRLVMIRRSTA
jgi:hypothetical protein